MLSIIVAMSQNRVIGRNNQLPWHLSEDLKRFKKITMGHPIIMGRKTFDSIGQPLPGRENIILSRNPSFKEEGVTVIQDLNKFIDENDPIEKFVIGGSQIYNLALPHINKLYMTFIEKDFEGDTYFPQIDLENNFELMEKSDQMLSEKEALPYRFLIFKKRVKFW